MNRYGLIFNLVLSIFVLLGSCNKSDIITYTGLYHAQIKISFSQGNQSVYDTTFETIIIVNQAYGDQNIQLQWSLDEYFSIHGKTMRIPNELTLRINQPLFSYQKTLTCQQGDCYYFDKAQGQIYDNALELMLRSSSVPLTIQIKATKYQD